MPGFSALKKLQREIDNDRTSTLSSDFKAASTTFRPTWYCVRCLQLLPHLYRCVCISSLNRRTGGAVASRVRRTCIHEMSFLSFRGQHLDNVQLHQPLSFVVLVCCSFAVYQYEVLMSRPSDANNRLFCLHSVQCLQMLDWSMVVRSMSVDPWSVLLQIEARRFFSLNSYSTCRARILLNVGR